ncbi:MAG: flagellar brake protein [Azonexus sp.]
MSPTNAEQPLPIFEIASPDEHAQFFLSNRREVLHYLSLIARQRSIATAYLDDGRLFFPSTIIAVDEAANLLFLDPAQTEEDNRNAGSARQVILVANLDRVKMQIRLPGLKTTIHQGQNALCAPIPEAILRLQRREFFRLEPPLGAPIHCQLAVRQTAGSSKTFDLSLSDISGGGVSLAGEPELAEYFPRDTMFADCRLEIPGEGVILINLRVRKTIEMSLRSGHRCLRIGCEFVNLPGTRLAFIERYIARIERERKARESGLLEA